MPIVKHPSDQIRALVEAIGLAIDEQCRTDRVHVADIISATSTILGGALQMVDTTEDRQHYLEEVIRNLRQVTYGQGGSA